jgi:hypothetical protein
VCVALDGVYVFLRACVSRVCLAEWSFADSGCGILDVVGDGGDAGSGERAGLGGGAKGADIYILILRSDVGITVFTTATLAVMTGHLVEAL